MPTVNKTTKTGTKKVSIKDIASRIQSLGTAIPSRKLKANIYGMSGTGKTTFWASAPKKILALMVSGGNPSGELLSLDTPEYHDSVDVLKLESSMEIPAIAQMLRDNPDAYETVVLDHATALQELVLAELLKLSEIPVQLSWGIATQKQWGQIGIQVKEHLRHLISLNMNVFIIAQEREFSSDADETDEDFKVAPYVASALSPATVGWLNYSVDYILNTYIRPKTKSVTTKIAGKSITKQVRVKGQVEYCMRTAPHPMYATKFRVPKGHPLPNDIIDPTYEKLMAIIEAAE